MQITRSKDSAAAVAILRRVAVEFVERDEMLWDPESLSERDFAVAAAREELVLGFEGATPVATMLVQERDPLYWPHDPLGEARYLHKIAVLQQMRGRGWSGALIAWARAEALTHNARFLRLNTAPRAKLIGLYERHGFVLIDAVARQFAGIAAVRLELPLFATCSGRNPMPTM